ncbi:flagellar hook capping FlgD N-terminal domain-containing protein [Frigidibacter sp. ROC022]|uniref:flagellar hook capping FlgD N-terminal domain-containing protein n=1 Tax=Frigidibacter sp. ROC022 TaxID=2971796 RepID=UPI00215A13F6|nr:flagellar hook capping FlgD N-terminal domain-containing protein [Frigidibacter sp. ROC022]MCR8724377.1 flagellar hook assembly protein FlgD [Frigidibacter sp. ROC022]
MDIIQTAPQSRLTTQQARDPADTLSSDFNTFLRMMTTQMQNQDPLNPLDSSDFAVQLATFSGVEQQVRTNDLLAAQVELMGMSQLAGWVGMEARTTAPVAFSGSPVELAPTPRPEADSAQLVVRDSGGEEVQRLAIPVTADAVTWAGTDAGGTPLGNGVYSFSVESFTDGKLSGTDPVASYARVTEARTEAGELVLILDSGARVAASTVLGLRSPS